MDGPNLMEFNSPVKQEKTASCSRINRSTSPGNNPFDSLCKNIVNSSEAVPNLCTSTEFTDNFFDFNNDKQDFGRESPAYLKDVDISGRESLGILKLEMLNTSFGALNLNVPSVSLLNSSEQHKKSKEFSNSPLNTAFLQPFSYSNNSDAKNSAISTGSSVSTNPSPFFNSASLDASELSKIYSINFSRTFNLASQSEDILNVAFLNTCSSRLKFGSTCLGEDAIRERKVSLPDFNTIKVKTEGRVCCSESAAVVTDDVNLQEVDNAFNDSVFIEANHLASKIADGSILADISFEENLLDCTSPPSFEDVEESDSGEVKVESDMIFKTIDKMIPIQQTQCNNLKVGDRNEVNDPSDINSNIEDCNSNSNVKLICNDSNSPTNKEFKQNLSNIFNTSQRCNSSSGSSSESSKCRDANELLQNLSAIINSEHRDPQQNIQGQQLLFSLADILCSGSSKISTKDDNLEDSGHSSIEQEEQPNELDMHACYEVLDLRVASKSQDNEQVLDLSKKAQAQNVKRLSQSFSFPAPKVTSAKSYTNLKAASVSSTSSLEHNKSKAGLDSGKLKPKKLEDKSSSFKKGPLKAVIPLGNMSKCKNLGGKMSSVSVTPPKSEQQNSTVFKVKRTSTPITEPELKPVAQSTPDGLHSVVDRNKPISCSSQLKKRRFYCPVSPLVRPSSIGDNSINSSNKSSRSGSTPNLSNQSGTSKRDSLIPSPKSLHRRHSASELKASNKPTLKRSYSIGMDHKPPTVFDKLKRNVATTSSNASLRVTGVNSFKNAISSIGKKNGALQEKKSGTLQERNGGITNNIKSFSLLGKFRKSSTGKENVAKKNSTEKIK